MQTKKHSLLESCTNVVIGYGVAISSQLIIFPWFDIDIPLSDNFIIGFYFTCISLVRSYVLRRYFNRKTILAHWQAHGVTCKNKIVKPTYRTKFIQ